MSSPADHPNAAYPSWLPKPACRVVVTIGPVAGCCRDRVAGLAAAGDIVIELGAIIAELAGEPAATASGDWLVPALGRRNAALAALAYADAGATAWFITGAPKPWQRQHWRLFLGAEVVVVDPGLIPAVERATADGLPVRFVHQWYAEASTERVDAGAPRPRANTNERGYGPSHRKNRDKQLAREPHCRLCKAEGRTTPATHLDHIEAFTRVDGSIDFKLWGDPKNWRSLCATHHMATGGNRHRHAKPPGNGADGRPLDPAHPWNRTKV